MLREEQNKFIVVNRFNFLMEGSIVVDDSKCKLDTTVTLFNDKIVSIKILNLGNSNFHLISAKNSI